jgi:hypothetical protein
MIQVGWVKLFNAAAVCQSTAYQCTLMKSWENGGAGPAANTIRASSTIGDIFGMYIAYHIFAKIKTYPQWNQFKY